MRVRPITPADIPALFELRVLTDENRLNREQLASLGITEDSVAARMRHSHQGWLAEDSGQVVGFALGDRTTGELWVIAVHPHHICRGIGTALLAAVERWLAAEGCRSFWLTTGVDPTLRAYPFYRNRGWQDWKIENGLRYMHKAPA